MSKPKMTEKQDRAADRRAGIKEGSKKDQALDKKRGFPAAFIKKGAKK